jgi:hypothetical protein
VKQSCNVQGSPSEQNGCSNTIFQHRSRSALVHTKTERPSTMSLRRTFVAKDEDEQDVPVQRKS